MDREILLTLFIFPQKSKKVTLFTQLNTDTDRYILEQGYHNARSFVSAKFAHFNIAFPCVSHLNNSFCLIPPNCTDTERALMIIQGYHGLHPYANKFWIKHVLACCKLYVESQSKLPVEFLGQLQHLLRFRQHASQQATNYSY